MSGLGLINLLVLLLVVGAIGWLIWWVATHFFPEPLKTIALIVVGIILLVALLYALVGLLPLPPLQLGNPSSGGSG